MSAVVMGFTLQQTTAPQATTEALITALISITGSLAKAHDTEHPSFTGFLLGTGLGADLQLRVAAEGGFTVQILTTACSRSTDPLDAILVAFAGALFRAGADTLTIHTDSIPQAICWAVTAGGLNTALLFTAHRSWTISVLATARDAASPLTKSTAQAASVALTKIRLSTKALLITAQLSFTRALRAGGLTALLNTDTTWVTVLSAVTALWLLTATRLTALGSSALSIFQAGLLTATRLTETLRETALII